MASIEEIIDDLSLLDDWEDRYRNFIEHGIECPNRDNWRHAGKDN